MRVLGIDPGTRHLGFGIVDWRVDAQRADYVICGVIDLPAAAPMPTRLKQLQEELIQVIDKYSPDLVGMEDLFFGINVQSAIRIGEARAVVMLTLAQYDLPLIEIPPASVKKAVTGQGRAGKEQVQKMVTLLLELNRPPSSPDAADALAVALAAGMKRRGLGPGA